MNLVKRHFFTTIEKQKKIRSVTKCNDAGFLVEIAIFSQKKNEVLTSFFFIQAALAGWYVISGEAPWGSRRQPRRVSLLTFASLSCRISVKSEKGDRPMLIAIVG